MRPDHYAEILAAERWERQAEKYAAEIDDLQAEVDRLRWTMRRCADKLEEAPVQQEIPEVVNVLRTVAGEADA